MGIFNKTPKNGSIFVENFGATEPVGSATENVNENFGNYGETVGPTDTVINALIDYDIPNHNGNSSVVIDDINATQPAWHLNVMTQEIISPVVGWLVCIMGPNQGKEFRIHSDYNYMGSLNGDIIVPNDPKISREKHMMITYDPTDRNFYIAPASGANIIRLNDKALIGGGQQLKNYDIIKTGDSTFMFIGFCGENFGWETVIND